MKNKQHKFPIAFVRSAAVTLFAAAVALAVGLTGENVNAQTGSTSTLEDLAGVEDLMARFNADAGSPRLVLLLSPT